MSERKVINKYYSPDFDPAKVPRAKKKSKQNDVRLMAPFNMKCNNCGDYIANATKFNAKKETVQDKTYNSILIFRFYIKCPRCMSAIVFRTNPKDQSYEVEYGATENFMAAKMAAKQAEEEAEAEKEEEEINPMKHLESRTKQSKMQMEASEQIQNMRSIKHQYNKVNLDDVIKNRREEARVEASRAIEDVDDETRQEALRLFKRKAIEAAEPSTSSLVTSSRVSTALVKSTKKPLVSSALSDLRKKVKKVSDTNSTNKV